MNLDRTAQDQSIEKDTEFNDINETIHEENTRKQSKYYMNILIHA